MPVLFAASLAVLTGIGQFRRSRRVASAVLAGFFFPLVWVVWYRRDTPTRGVLIQRPVPASGKHLD
ncbi:hypothetical protein [Rhodococcus sp. OK302]|uniref:hypothetical protein n=1 Tax=Rhodococcus sp. OK302 TaxID=1882769 RepID=UPI001594ECAA|nr:hypothetical protein [Rhodococcus sp. OK302]